MEASVARCLRTPPEGANPQGFVRDYRAALSSETCLSIVVVGNYKFSPITVVQCRAKVRSLHPRRSYFAPIKNRPEIQDWARRFMVEAPGTAPGSEWLITSAVYRHSRHEAGTGNIGGRGGDVKRDGSRQSAVGSRG